MITDCSAFHATTILLSAEGLLRNKDLYDFF